jgi:Domain of unknown function (DUF4351)
MSVCATIENSIVMGAIAVDSWGEEKGCDALFAVLEVIVRGELRRLKCIYRSVAPQAPHIPIRQSGDVAVLRESPWYQEIRQEGRQEDEQRGRTQEAQSLILRLLSRRVGTLSPGVEAQVRALDLPRLEALGEALLDFTGMDDLVVWLQNHS